MHSLQCLWSCCDKRNGDLPPCSQAPPRHVQPGSLKSASEKAAPPSPFVHIAHGKAGGYLSRAGVGHPACLCHEVIFNPSPVSAAGSRQGMWKAEAAEAGIPTNMFSIRTNAAQGKRRTYGGTMVALAEYGSFGVEFWALSNCTGNPVYAETAERIYR